MITEISRRVVPAPETPQLPERPSVFASYAYSEPESEDQSVPLSHYFWILRRHKWKILAFVLVAVVSVFPILINTQTGINGTFSIIYTGATHTYGTTVVHHNANLLSGGRLKFLQNGISVILKRTS